MKTCFIVSPIGEEESEVRKRADQLFKYILSPVCDECEFEIIRVDKLNQADTITQTILDNLRNSELVIADITGHNPNVFFEIGFRASTGRPIIHLKKKGEKIPFDISGIRTFEYDLRDLDAVASIKERLKQTILAFKIDDTPINDAGTMEIEKNEPQNEIPKLLPVLFQLQDELSQLRSEIHNKDTETIQAIIKAMQPTTPAEDPNTAIMKALIPELLRNPNSAKTLMEIDELARKKRLAHD